MAALRPGPPRRKITIYGWSTRSDKVGKNESSLVVASRIEVAYSASCSLHSATTAHLTCINALRVLVNISRRSEWWRSATLTAGPCVSLLENRKPTTAWLVGLGRSPVRLVTPFGELAGRRAHRRRDGLTGSSTKTGIWRSVLRW